MTTTAVELDSSSALYAVSSLIGERIHPPIECSMAEHSSISFHWPSSSSINGSSQATSSLNDHQSMEPIYRPPSLREQTEALSLEYPSRFVRINTDQLQLQRMASFRKSLIYVSCVINVMSECVWPAVVEMVIEIFIVRASACCEWISFENKWFVKSFLSILFPNTSVWMLAYVCEPNQLLIGVESIFCTDYRLALETRNAISVGMVRSLTNSFQRPSTVSLLFSLFFFFFVINSRLNIMPT